MANPLRDGDPSHIGPYTLHARLGGGGMGQVYLGRSPGGHTVAVKVIHLDLAEDPAFRRRFATEVKAARKVGGFYTAHVVDAAPDGDPPWLATAYIPGPTLYEAVETHGPLPPASVAALGAGLAEGLAAIHACAIVHRDLKPGNILLAADGPRVIDFGIARALDTTSATRSRTVMGTAGFMSPEQVRGTDIGPPSDVFTLGCVLGYAATGRSPFGEGPLEALGYRIVHETPDLTGVPANLVSTVDACLAKDPRDRPGLGQVLTVLTTSAGADPGRPWLPEALTEIIAHRTTTPTLANTRQEQPSTPEPDKPKKNRRTTPGLGTAEMEGAELVLGNLSPGPLGVVVDGVSVGTASVGGRGRFSVEPGEHTVEVDSAGRRSLLRRIETEPSATVRMAFDVGSGADARPEPLEALAFMGGRISRAVVKGVLGALIILVCLGLGFAGTADSGERAVTASESMIILAIASLIGGAMFGLIGLAGTPTHLILREGELEFARPSHVLYTTQIWTIRWSDLVQISMVGEGSNARLVVWPRKNLQLDPPLVRELHGGKVVCSAGEIGAGDLHGAERLRAALRWFADDRWVEQAADS